MKKYRVMYCIGMMLSIIVSGIDIYFNVRALVLDQEHSFIERLYLNTYSYTGAFSIFVFFIGLYLLLVSKRVFSGEKGYLRLNNTFLILLSLRFISLISSIVISIGNIALYDILQTIFNIIAMLLIAAPYYRAHHSKQPFVDDKQ